MKAFSSLFLFGLHVSRRLSVCLHEGRIITPIIWIDFKVSFSYYFSFQYFFQFDFRVCFEKRSGKFSGEYIKGKGEGGGYSDFKDCFRANENSVCKN